MGSTVQTDSPQSFKFLGKIGSRAVTVLIGTAATHNFISKEVATELQLPVERTRRFHVESAFGAKVEGAQLCRNIVLKTQGIETVHNFFLTNLAIADVVLGGEWLGTLGEYSLALNDGALTMTFNWQGRTVTLQSDPSVANVQRVDEAGRIIHESAVMLLRWDEEY